MKDIGEVIRYTRKKVGITQKLLSKRTGITRTWLSEIETGKKKNLSIKSMEKIGKALGVPIPFAQFYLLQVKDVPRDKQPYFKALKPVIDKYILKLFPVLK